MQCNSARMMLSVISLLLALSFPIQGMSNDIPVHATNSTAPQTAVQSLNCIFCLEDVPRSEGTTVNLACNHEYHIPCLKDGIKRFLLEHQNREFPCPLCRHRVNAQELAALNVEISRADVLEYLGNEFRNTVSQETLDETTVKIRAVLAHPETARLLQEAFHNTSEEAIELLETISERLLPIKLDDLKSGAYMERLRDICPALTSSAIADILYIIFRHFHINEQFLDNHIRSSANQSGGSSFLTYFSEYLPTIRRFISLCEQESTIDEDNALVIVVRNCEKRKLLSPLLRIAAEKLMPDLRKALQDLIAGDAKALFMCNILFDILTAEWKEEEVLAGLTVLLEENQQSDDALADPIDAISTLLYPFADGSADLADLRQVLLRMPRYDREFQQLLRSALVSFFTRRAQTTNRFVAAVSNDNNDDDNGSNDDDISDDSFVASDDDNDADASPSLLDRANAFVRTFDATLRRWIFGN